MWKEVLQLIITLLAILKVDACYVPCDLKLPVDRVEFILKDTKTNYLVTTQESIISTAGQQNFDALKINLLLWDNFSQLIDHYDPENFIITSFILKTLPTLFILQVQLENPRVYAEHIVGW